MNFFSLISSNISNILQENGYNQQFQIQFNRMNLSHGLVLLKDLL